VGKYFGTDAIRGGQRITGSHVAFKVGQAAPRSGQGQGGRHSYHRQGHPHLRRYVEPRWWRVPAPPGPTSSLWWWSTARHGLYTRERGADAASSFDPHNPYEHTASRIFNINGFSSPTTGMRDRVLNRPWRSREKDLDEIGTSKNKNRKWWTAHQPIITCARVRSGPKVLTTAPMARLPHGQRDFSSFPIQLTHQGSARPPISTIGCGSTAPVHLGPHGGGRRL
jgi:hypothetical protein